MVIGVQLVQKNFAPGLQHIRPRPILVYCRS